MENILMRSDAPLTDAQWQLIDATVSEVVGRVVVGRRILDLYGPLGFGAYTVPLYTYNSAEGEPVRAKVTRQLTMSTLMKAHHHRERPGADEHRAAVRHCACIAAAATQSALANKLIFSGDAGEGVEGLLNVTGRLTLPFIGTKARRWPTSPQPPRNWSRRASTRLFRRHRRCTPNSSASTGGAAFSKSSWWRSRPRRRFCLAFDPAGQSVGHRCNRSTSIWRLGWISPRGSSRRSASNTASP